MQIKIISPGKTRDPHLRAGIQKYLNLIGHYLSISVTWVKAEPLQEGKNEAQVLAAEAGRMQKCLTAHREYLVVLDQPGQRMTTEKLAQHFQQVINRGTRQLVFVIGGAIGCATPLKQQADLLFSLSPLTFTHEMTRLILLEQLYRVCTILQGGKYHK